MRTNRQYRLPLLAFGLACSLWSCGGPVSRSQFVLGTVCTIRVEDRGGAALLDRAFARLRQIEDELSVNKPGSQIDAVNAASGSAPVAVGSDALAIVRRDLQLASWSDGAFDPSVGPLVKLWGIGFERTGTASPPAPADIAAAKALVDWKDVRLDEAKSEIFLARKGMALDLGGNVLVLGSWLDGKPWRIALQDPFSSERGAYLGVASLVDETMVTSGVYERFFIDKATGKRYHHILDTSTGYPVDNGLVSVTIVTRKSFDADGFTTTIFALGRERGMALAAAQGVGVILVDKDRKVYMSPGVSTYFEITDSSFSPAE